MAGLSAGDENFCASHNNELPPGTSIRQETRNENETWCIYETPFDSLDDLKAIYGLIDTRVNDISTVDGNFTYDVDLDLSGDSSNMPTGADIYWRVTLPGKVIENNATEQDGNTLKWKLQIGQVNNIRATSKTGGVNFGDNVLWYIFGGACLCLCGVVLVIIGGVVFFLLRRKKKASEVETPVETPAP